MAILIKYRRIKTRALKYYNKDHLSRKRKTVTKWKIMQKLCVMHSYLTSIHTHTRNVDVWIWKFDKIIIMWNELCEVVVCIVNRVRKCVLNLDYDVLVQFLFDLALCRFIYYTILPYSYKLLSFFFLDAKTLVS